MRKQLKQTSYNYMLAIIFFALNIPCRSVVKFLGVIPLLSLLRCWGRLLGLYVILVEISNLY